MFALKRAGQKLDRMILEEEALIAMLYEHGLTTEFVDRIVTKL